MAKNTSQPRPAPAGARPSPPRDRPASGPGTVHRVVRMLATVATTRTSIGIGVGQISEQIRLPVPTVHRLLQLLRKEGIVEWNNETHRYNIGPSLYRIAFSTLENSAMLDIVNGHLAQLAAEVGETAMFALYHPADRTLSIEAQAEGSHVLQYRSAMHRRETLVWGASGKAILAFLEKDAIDAVMGAVQRHSAEGLELPPRAELDVELTRIRGAGFAVSEDELFLGGRGVAAPVSGPGGVCGSICIASPKSRIRIQEILDLGVMVKSYAARVSQSLSAQSGNRADP